MIFKTMIDKRILILHVALVIGEIMSVGAWTYDGYVATGEKVGDGLRNATVADRSGRHIDCNRNFSSLQEFRDYVNARK